MDEIKDFVCNIEVKSVADWVGDGKAKEEGCPPCLIGTLSSYYLGVLEEAGETTIALELKKVFEEGDILTISKELDKIKTDVGKALSKQLKDLDCFAQTFEPD